jgi:cation diffusion facilitator family transporter
MEGRSRRTATPDPAEVPLTRYAWLSIAAALTTICIKTVAFLITDSVGLLSDALESTVNLVAGVGALVALTVAARPADEEHAYGHAKAEYFAAGAEGAMILIAAGSIVVTAIPRLIEPVALSDVGAGLLVSAVAGAVNLAVAVILGRAGRRHRSITLEADGKHLMTDVWTSVGVLVAVGLVAVTGWERLDPLIALVVATNIVVSGVVLVRRSVQGLMDRALGRDDLDAIRSVLRRHTGADTQFHGLRTRQAGRRSFMSVHVLVPGAWSVQRAHDLVERIERDLRAQVPNLTVITHLEPLEDPRSFADVDLDRTAVPPSARPGGGPITDPATGPDPDRPGP